MKEIKIATWNVNSLKVRLQHVIDWLKANEPDIVAVQETKLLDENFPTTAFADIGYHAIFSGQKTYNGVAIFSKSEPQEILKDIPQLADPQRRILIATINNIRIINLYVPNGEAIASPKYEYKLDWLKKINEFIYQELLRYSQLVVLGDFNIAPSEDDVYDPKAWENHVLFSLPERDAFQQLVTAGLVDSFRLFEQPPRSYSWWDYRMLAFRRKQGLRIDHILVNKQFAASCKSCIIDIEPRKLERPSDHAPVLANFSL